MALKKMKSETISPQTNNQAVDHSVNLLFNSAVEETAEALSIQFNQMVYDQQRQGKTVTVLSLGEAFFDIPLFDFNELNIEKGYHYSDSRGIPELREKISQYYARYKVEADPNTDILISAGSKPLIFMSILAVAQPGEEIIVHEPCWLSYPEQAKLCRVGTKFIPYDEPVKNFSKYFSPRTRMMVINNPNNPAGRLYTQEELSGLYEECLSRNIYLLVDEAYSDFVLDDSFYSAARLSQDRSYLIVINSLSKNMGISGWRIGYTISHPDFIKVLLKINQHTITCAPTILLQYCAKYFDEILSYTLPQVRAVVEKRQRIEVALQGLGLKYLNDGSTTFYFFVSIGDYPGTSMDLCTKLLQEHSICLVPGCAYGSSTDRFVRLSIGTESEEKIIDALKIFKNEITQTKSYGAVYSSEDDF